MKTNKHQTLLFVKEKNVVRAHDIVQRFDYASGTARSYLSYLSRHGLLERTSLGYVLSERGKERLQYFDALGCGSFDCPLCVTKKASHYTCPRCDYELPKEKAKILPEWNTILFSRHAGVYCPLCQKLIFGERQAQLLGIPKEANV